MKALPLDDVIMGESDAAAILGIATETLIGYRRRGSGPPYFRLSGHTVRYSKARLLEWLTEREVQGAVVQTVKDES